MKAGLGIGQMELAQNKLAHSQLENLSRGSDDREKLKEIATKFESMFFGMLFKDMRSNAMTEQEDPFFGQSHSQKMYQSMLDQEYADILGKSGSMGLAKTIVDQLMPQSKQGVSADDRAQSLDNYRRYSKPGNDDIPAPVLPLHGPVSSGFGMRNHPITGEYVMHKGIDIAVPIGTAVRSTESGKVRFAGELKNYGKTIIVTHKNGLESVYAHLDKIEVKQGQILDKNQQIGESGNTGRSTGPHLHFELRRNGQAIDPLKYMANPKFGTNVAKD